MTPLEWETRSREALRPSRWRLMAHRRVHNDAHALPRHNRQAPRRSCLFASGLGLWCEWCLCAQKKKGRREARRIREKWCATKSETVCPVCIRHTAFLCREEKCIDAAAVSLASCSYTASVCFSSLGSHALFSCPGNGNRSEWQWTHKRVRCALASSVGHEHVTSHYGSLSISSYLNRYNRQIYWIGMVL